MTMPLNLSPRKKEVFLTVASNLALQIVTALCGFVLPPLVIGTFGSAVNGMVSSISQFIAYLNIVEAGVGGAAIAALYKPLALGDTESRNGILSATAKFYNRSGVLFTLLIFMLAFVYPLIVGAQVDRTQSALMVLVLGITGAAEFFLIGKYRVLLTADKKVYVISLVQMVALVVNTAVAVVLIKAGCSILVVKLASALVYLSRYVFLALFVRRKYADVDFHAKPDTQAISQSKNVLVHQISALVVYNSPIVFITLFCSLKDASIYAVYAMIFNALNQLLNAFSNGMQSFFGESFEKDTLIQTQCFFDKYESLFFLAEWYFFSLAYILVMPFMALYTKNMIDADYMQPNLAFLFVLSGVCANIRLPSSQVINAAGHFRRTQWRSVTECIINIITSLFFVFKVGFIGVLYGSVCSSLYRYVDMTFYVSKRILRKSPVKNIMKVLALFFLLGAIFLLEKYLNVSVSSYFQWTVNAFLYAFILFLPLALVSIKILRRK